MSVLLKHHRELPLDVKQQLEEDTTYYVRVDSESKFFPEKGVIQGNNILEFRTGRIATPHIVDPVVDTMENAVIIPNEEQYEETKDNYAYQLKVGTTPFEVLNGHEDLYRFNRWEMNEDIVDHPYTGACYFIRTPSIVPRPFHGDTYEAFMNEVYQTLLARNYPLSINQEILMPVYNLPKYNPTSIDTRPIFTSGPFVPDVKFVEETHEDQEPIMHRVYDSHWVQPTSEVSIPLSAKLPFAQDVWVSHKGWSFRDRMSPNHKLIHGKILQPPTLPAAIFNERERNITIPELSTPERTRVLSPGIEVEPTAQRYIEPNPAYEGETMRNVVTPPTSEPDRLGRISKPAITSQVETVTTRNVGERLVEYPTPAVVEPFIEEETLRKPITYAFGTKNPTPWFFTDEFASRTNQHTLATFQSMPFGVSTKYVEEAEHSRIIGEQPTPWLDSGEFQQTGLSTAGFMVSSEFSYGEEEMDVSSIVWKNETTTAPTFICSGFDTGDQSTTVMFESTAFDEDVVNNYQLAMTLSNYRIAGSQFEATRLLNQLKSIMIEIQGDEVQYASWVNSNVEEIGDDLIRSNPKYLEEWANPLITAKLQDIDQDTVQMKFKFISSLLSDSRWSEEYEIPVYHEESEIRMPTTTVDEVSRVTSPVMTIKSLDIVTEIINNDDVNVVTEPSFDLYDNVGLEKPGLLVDPSNRMVKYTVPEEVWTVAAPQSTMEDNHRVVQPVIEARPVAVDTDVYGIIRKVDQLSTGALFVSSPFFKREPTDTQVEFATPPFVSSSEVVQHPTVEREVVADTSPVFTTSAFNSKGDTSAPSLVTVEMDHEIVVESTTSYERKVESSTAPELTTTDFHVRGENITPYMSSDEFVQTGVPRHEVIEDLFEKSKTYLYP